MSKRLVVSGAQGFLAGSVLAQAGPEWEVHAVSRGAPLVQRVGLHWHRLDPLAPRSWTTLFHEVRPQAVLHTAALADIDYCQGHADEAWRVNVGLTDTLARLCAAGGAGLVFCSTDSIFDGEGAPYHEASLPRPVNRYAETKVAAEQIVARLETGAVVARLALIYGLPVLGTGNSFLARLLGSLRAGRPVGLPSREIRTPIDVISAGRALLELASGPYHGIFHLAGNDRLNRCQLARRLAARFGLATDLIVAQDPDATMGASRAPRPRDVSLDNAKARATLRTPMLNVEEGISLILQAPHRPIP
jgi:dTDP-4-dehydrorhamnose reductase